jgi:hypothetical protein
MRQSMSQTDIPGIAQLGEQEGLVLPRYARECIREALGGPRPEAPANFEEEGACFVTLHFGEELHGCIGSIEARRLLVEDVASNAVSAAMFDPRAQPIQLGDVDALTVEVSVLSPLEPIEFADENSALEALRPHVDGVVLRAGMHRATFLPQVWESLHSPREFIAELKRKAGMGRNAWSDDLKLYRYTVQKFTDAARIRYREAASA